MDAVGCFTAGHRSRPWRRTRLNAAPRSASSSAEVAPAAGGRARTTTALPGESCASRARSRWRSRRLTVVRTTAPPTERETTTPARAGPSPCSTPDLTATVCTCTTSRRPGDPARRPRRTVARKSRLLLRRWEAGSTGSQAERLARPLARRPARMARPARVRILSLKPWVLARRRLFGWKVRLLTKDSKTKWCSRWPVRRSATCGRPRRFVGMRQRPSTVDLFTVRSRPRAGQTSRREGRRDGERAGPPSPVPGDSGLSPLRPVVSVGWAHEIARTTRSSAGPPRGHYGRCPRMTALPTACELPCG